jgi:hypothetical protein
VIHADIDDLGQGGHELSKPPETPEPDSPAESSESLNNFGTKKK